eukprot:6709955-Pyramimonas_sp.AAC.1
MGESACSTAVILCVALATLSALATIVYFFDGRDPMYDMENGIHNGFQGYSRKYVPLVEPAKAYDTSLIEHDLMAKSLEKQSLARLANGRPISELLRADRPYNFAVETGSGPHQEPLAPPAPVSMHIISCDRIRVPSCAPKIYCAVHWDALCVRIVIGSVRVVLCVQGSVSLVRDKLNRLEVPLHTTLPGEINLERGPSESDRPYVFVDPIFEQDRLKFHPAAPVPTSDLPGERVRDALDATFREPSSDIQPFVGGDLEQDGRFLAALKARQRAHPAGSGRHTRPSAHSQGPLSESHQCGVCGKLGEQPAHSRAEELPRPRVLGGTVPPAAHQLQRPGVCVELIPARAPRPAKVRGRCL